MRHFGDSNHRVCQPFQNQTSSCSSIQVISLNERREEGGEWDLFRCFLALSRIISRHWRHVMLGNRAIKQGSSLWEGPWKCSSTDWLCGRGGAPLLHRPPCKKTDLCSGRQRSGTFCLWRHTFPGFSYFIGGNVFILKTDRMRDKENEGKWGQLHKEMIFCVCYIMCVMVHSAGAKNKQQNGKTIYNFTISSSFF